MKICRFAACAALLAVAGVSGCSSFVSSEPDIRVSNVKDFGAVGDGVTDDTAAIQRAVDAGGIVKFPRGVYLSGSIYLKSNGGLLLDDNAVLRGHPDISKWPIRPICHERATVRPKGKVEAHLVCALSVTNVTVSGGVFDGNGTAFLTNGFFRKAGAREFRRKVGTFPGQLLWFNDCRNVKVTDTMIRESQFWALMFHGCDDVDVKNVHVYSRGDIMNADGIDIDCCNRVNVSDCVVDVGDDALTVRAYHAGLIRPRPCENVVVENCVLRSDYAHAIRVGVGNGVIRNCRFSNILVNDSRGGIHVNPKFSNGLAGVAISDIVFDNVYGKAISFISVTLDYIHSRRVTYTGVLENIEMKNLRGVSNLPIVFNGNKTGKLRNITISDSEFTIRDFAKTSKAERDYFYVSPRKEDDRHLIQTNRTENIVLKNVKITEE